MLIKISTLLGSYLLGALPFGVIVSRVFYKKDVRNFGSRNTGATNVWRVLGKKPGMATLALDVMKGVVPVILARKIFSHDPLMMTGMGLAAIIGHNWSVFLMGSGGKGVATSAGVFLALIPVQGLLAFLTFLIFFLSTRHVSVGSIAGALALLIATLLLPTPSLIQALVLLSSLMILIKHIPNMKRLARGEEPKVSFK
ncbi:MAG: Glycerol-3-phosphate acyltransferase [Elusimicrobia bacterium]|nr:Glycerol-3-phosphate acyltransferase [Elusimicrobiota bacterium]